MNAISITSSTLNGLYTSVYLKNMINNPFLLLFVDPYISELEKVTLSSLKEQLGYSSTAYAVQVCK